MKKSLIALIILAALYACGGSNTGEPANQTPAADNSPAPSTPATASGSDKGIGKFTEVKVDPTLNAEMAAKGQKVFDVKCSSCHKLTDEKLVGPGWKGVTSRHTPEWIMNFVTNVDEMLNKDPKAQAQLEICLVRMPNQNLTDDDARHVLEYMRQVDGVK